MIEGVVDDDSEAEIAAVTDGDRDGTAGDRHVTGGDRYVTAASAGRKLSSGKAKVVKYLEPLKVNIFYAHFHIPNLHILYLSIYRYSLSF